ncbi:MAG: XRE family transcriptional regulator [Rhizobiales bacterium]|nr:XRE family transcriptional regulator [Hyphomicrobiales bacterium]
MTTTRGQRLRLAREQFFKSARQAARALDMAASTYGAHERAEDPGGRDYGPDEARIYARRFKVAPEYLLTGRGPRPDHDDESSFEPDAPDESRPPVVRVKGYVGAGAQAHFYAVNQGDLDEAPAPADATLRTVAVEIRGNSLGPTWDRALVFYDDVRRPVTPDLIGKLCVVGLENGQVLVKKLMRSRAHGLFNLVSDFGDPIENVKVEWAARVKSLKPR